MVVSSQMKFFFTCFPINSSSSQTILSRLHMFITASIKTNKTNLLASKKVLWFFLNTHNSLADVDCQEAPTYLYGEGCNIVIVPHPAFQLHDMVVKYMDYEIIHHNRHDIQGRRHPEKATNIVQYSASHGCKLRTMFSNSKKKAKDISPWTYKNRRKDQNPPVRISYIKKAILIKLLLELF